MICRLLALLFLVPSLAFAAAAPGAYEDVNDNGVFDAGDKDITAEITAGPEGLPGPPYITAHSVVVSQPVKLSGRHANYLIQSAKNISILANVSADGYRNNVSLDAVAGKVTISPGVKLSAVDTLFINGGAGITIGAGASLRSAGGGHNSGLLTLETGNGDISIGERVTLSARWGVHLGAPLGSIIVAPGLNASATSGSVQFGAGEAISITGTKRLISPNTALHTWGEKPMAFTDNKGLGSKPIVIINRGGTVDTTGSRLPKGSEIVTD
jgi:hypothetical protein